MAHLIAAGVRSMNPATLGRNNFPQPSASEAALEGTVLRLEIPSDINALRQHEPDLALAWRTQTR